MVKHTVFLFVCLFVSYHISKVGHAKSICFNALVSHHIVY